MRGVVVLMLAAATRLAMADNPHCGAVVPTAVYDCAKAGTFVIGADAQLQRLILRRAGREDAVEVLGLQLQYWPANGFMLGVGQRAIYDAPSVYGRDADITNQVSGFDNLELEARRLLDNKDRSIGLDVMVYLPTAANDVARDKTGVDLTGIGVLKYAGARLFLTPSIRFNPSSLSGVTAIAQGVLSGGVEARGEHWRFIGSAAIDQDYASSASRWGSTGGFGTFVLMRDWPPGVAGGVSVIGGYNSAGTDDNFDKARWQGAIVGFVRGMVR